MIPMADNLNHNSVSVTYELISKSLHLSETPDSPYFSWKKFMNKYTDLLPDHPVYFNP
jgi:hypothetical protein